MSSALAIAGVTAVMRDLLNDGLINHNAAGTLGSSVSVSVGPPDRVIAANGDESSQLNLFMYQVTPNAGWSNDSLPSRDASGRQRLTNAPLALNLHYLLSAYGSQDLHREILLGYAMQLFHEMPILSRKAIQVALNPSPSTGTDLPPALRALADSGLENQVEQIKITPEYLSTEEISKLWTATQSHLRPTAAYMASVVLIEATQPTRIPLPVLSRGPVEKPDPLNQDTWYESGVDVEPGLVPPLPMLEEVIPAGKQPVAQLNTAIELSGHHLVARPATDRTVLLSNERFDVHEAIIASDPPPAPKNSSTSLMFLIPPASAANFPVGIYSVSAQLQPSGEASNRVTNRVAMMLAPTITGLPLNVVRDGAGTAAFALNFVPALRAGQQVVLILGQQEIAPDAFVPPVNVLNFTIPHALVGSHLARLRIDGIESPIIDRSGKVPTFLNQRINIS